MNALNARIIALTLTACSSAVGPTFAADGGQGTTRNGEHPAVIQVRLAAQAGYDYASKFYPHPAWLALLPEAPHELGDHPAVIVARETARAAQVCTQCRSAPAEDRLAAQVH